MPTTIRRRLYANWYSTNSDLTVPAEVICHFPLQLAYELRPKWCKKIIAKMPFLGRTLDRGPTKTEIWSDVIRATLSWVTQIGVSVSWGGGGGAKGWVEVKKEKQMHFLHLQLAENLFMLVHKGVQKLNVPLGRCMCLHDQFIFNVVFYTGE